MKTLGKIENNCQLNPLKELWLGGIYPESFYSHFDNKTEDLFCKITELTNKDLNNFENVLDDIGINVVRPKFDQPLEKYMDDQDNLIKPPISPCDWSIVVDDTLYVTPQYHHNIQPFAHAIDEYKAQGQKVKILDRSTDSMCWVIFPSLLRMGKDLYFDFDPHHQKQKKHTIKTANMFTSTHRVHVSGTGGDHLDGVFCPLKNKQIFSSHYRSLYDKSFPGWNVFKLPEPKSNGHSMKWWLPGINYGHFNNEVIKVANNWLGNPQESVFEVNMLVVDEKNIICVQQDDNARKYFDSLGIKMHVADFKTCYFWDAGIHCLISDVYRSGPLVDFWPDRGQNGYYDLEDEYNI